MWIIGAADGSGEHMEYKVIEEIQIGRLRMEVAVGDITRLPQRVGAVVSFDDARLSACTGIAAAIRRAAGSAEVDREIAVLAGFPAPKGKLLVDEAGLTSAGALNAEAILHLVACGEDAKLFISWWSVEEALWLAERSRLNSVAIAVPDMFDGGSKFIRTICEGVRRFAAGFRPQVHVRSMVLVVQSADMGHMVPSIFSSTEDAIRWAPPPSRRLFLQTNTFRASAIGSDMQLAVERLFAEEVSLPEVVSTAPVVSPASSMATSPQPQTEPAAPSTPAPRLPEPIKRAHVQQKLVVFAGSGLSLGRDVRGGFPTWKQLPERLLEACRAHDALPDEAIAAKRAAFQIRMSLEQMLSELGTLQAALGRDYQRALNDIFRPRDATPGAAHRAVLQLGARAVLTTNYDQLLEMVPEPEGPPRQAYTWKGATRALHDIRDGRKVLLKVHGSAEDHESVVMSSLEYHRARTDASYTAVLRYLLQDNLFLFVGYGMNDPMDLDLALRANADDFKSAAQRHYVLLYNPTDADIDRLSREYNVRVIPYTDHDQVRLFLTALAST